MELEEALAILEDSDYSLYPTLFEMKRSQSGRIRRILLDNNKVSYSYENELISIPLGTAVQGSEDEDALATRARAFYEWVIYLVDTEEISIY